MKRSPSKKSKKPKKVTITKAKKDAWQACSRYIRYRDSYQGYAHCCTCEKILPIVGKGCIQAGHFIPGRNNSILYDEQNIHAQSLGCNVMKDPAMMFLEYEEFMLKTYGQDTVDRLKALRNDIVPMTVSDHQEKKLYFKKKLADLLEERGEANPWG